MPPSESRIDRYELIEVLGRGAMGVVYRARDPVIGRIVALKTLNLQDSIVGQLRDDSRVRFAREARAAGLLSHPNIVTVYDVGETVEGAAYIAMELVEGRTLREIVPPGERCSPEQTADLAIQTARALDYAHRRGVVHRDIKPANILVREDGLVKLADFGVARIETSDLTRTGQSLGSPSYIAPELLQSQPGDARADLFSLGVILYEILTGTKPFRSENLATLYHQIIALAPEPPSRLNGAVPAEWDAIVMKLLAKDPEQRYSSAAQLIEDLRSLESGKPLQLPSPPHDATARLAGKMSAEEIPEIVLDRVLEESSGSQGGGRTVVNGRRRLAPQRKALLALLAVTGFALAIILAAATLREGTAQPRVPVVETAKPAAVPASVALTVKLAHNMKTGHLGVTMDGEDLITESFFGKRASFKTQGAMSRRVEVPAGKHQFEVTVHDDAGRSLGGVTVKDIAEGSKPILSVQVKGLLRKSLTLTWE